MRLALQLAYLRQRRVLTHERRATAISSLVLVRWTVRTCQGSDDFSLLSARLVG